MKYFRLILSVLALAPLFGGGVSSAAPSLGAMHAFHGTPSAAGALPLDEALLSRQLLVYGRRAQSLLSQAHVAVVAAKNSHALLEEVCRQLVMVGVGRLTIVAEDPDSVTPLVAQLEEHNSVAIIRSSTSVRAIGAHVDAVVGAGLPLIDAVDLNNLCRKMSIKMIGCRASGATGYVFCDLIDHTVLSQTSHESNDPVPLLSITPIASEQDKINTKYAVRKEFDLFRIISIDDERLPVAVNDSCIIRSGQFNLSATVTSAVSSKECVVRVSNTDHEKINMLRASFSNTGGSIQRQFPPVRVTHSPLLRLLKNPKFESLNGCLAPGDATEQSVCLWASFIAHDKFLSSPSNGRVSSGVTETKNQFVASAGETARILFGDAPDLSLSSDSTNSRLLQKIYSLARNQLNRIKAHYSMKWKLSHGAGARIFDSFFFESHLPELALKRETLLPSGVFDYHDCFSDITLPTSSVIGGIVGQEVVKAITHSDIPISQILMFETFSGVSKKNPSHRFLKMPSLGQTEVQSGDSTPRKKNFRILVVGAGAIGCEVLKNLVGRIGGSGDVRSASGELGSVVYVADMDVIEKSNLNRQLLFRFVTAHCSNCVWKMNLMFQLSQVK